MERWIFCKKILPIVSQHTTIEDGFWRMCEIIKVLSMAPGIGFFVMIFTYYFDDLYFFKYSVGEIPKYFLNCLLKKYTSV